MKYLAALAVLVSFAAAGAAGRAQALRDVAQRFRPLHPGTELLHVRARRQMDLAALALAVAMILAVYP